LSYHPLNLAVRFILEVACLIAAGLWGYHWADGSYLLGLGLPISMMIIWAVFAVPGDRSRSGNAPVPIPGVVWLLLELSFFGFGTWAFFEIEADLFGWVFCTTIITHYLISTERNRWLLNN